MSRNGFRWIMVYQDHLTKFCVLRAVKSKRPVEVAGQLLDIFLLLGAPAILQSDNGTEFTAHVISELNEFWPRLVMVHGKPRHPQSQGSVERANGDIKDMLVAWLADNQTEDWVTDIKFVQFQKNSAHHSGIKRSPYLALFGSEFLWILFHYLHCFVYGLKEFRKFVNFLALKFRKFINFLNFLGNL